MTTLEYIERYKVICICRRMSKDDLMKLAHALFDGGLRLMEVTFDQQDPNCCEKAAEAISGLCREFGEEMQFGAGTVLSIEQVDAAKSAGAKYIISPNTNIAVIRHTKETGLVSIPGAMTPSEIMTAHENGADYVKLFPATWLGYSYLKDIMAPISHVKLIATGGVNEENLAQYLRLGIVGAGVSGRLTDKKLIEKGDFAEFTKRAAGFVSIANAG